MLQAKFSSEQAARVSGVPFGTLIEWDRKGFLKPTIPARGMGRKSGRRYTFRDLVRLRVARELRDRGVSLQALRMVVDRLCKRVPPQGLESVRLVAVGGKVHLVEIDQLVDPLTGQAAFSFVVNLKPLVRDVETQVRKMEGAV